MNWKSWLQYIWRKDKGMSEETCLIDEIERARKEWSVAYKRLDTAVGAEQVDYAIYTLEAAEKRYEMLLKQAKEQKVIHKPELGMSSSGKGRK
ncbi:YaaL family protein [Marinicrinis sediminis]|uniref:YaaL family protein n=1 Tax=Marinicrinis sediminis TaxID=1652465 RepID=A0ABW5RFC4_9BACL